MSFCWQTCFYILYQPALNNAKIENAAARQLKERRAAAFAVKKLMGGSLPYAGDCYSHTSSMWTGQTHQNYSDKSCNISNCKTLIINVLDLLILDIFRIFIV